MVSQTNKKPKRQSSRRFDSVSMRASLLWFTLSVLAILCSIYLVSENLTQKKIESVSKYVMNQALELRSETDRLQSSPNRNNRGIPIYQHTGTYYSAIHSEDWSKDCHGPQNTPERDKVFYGSCSDDAVLIGVRLRESLLRPSEREDFFVWTVVDPTEQNYLPSLQVVQIGRAHV